MGIDTETGGKFFTRRGNTIYHLEKHQHIPMDFRYSHGNSGREFDVRDLPNAYLGDDLEAVHAGDRKAHRRVITRAIDDDFAAGFWQA